MKNKTSWFSADKLEKDSIFKSIEEASRYVKGKLLDVGCGDKPYYSILAPKVIEYLGLDLDKGDIIGSATKIPFKTETFDTVLSTQVIEHLEQPELMISEVYRVLKKNGHFILTAPLLWCLHEEPNDFFRFTKYSLKKILEKKGFKIIYIKERGNWLISLGQMSSIFLESSFNRYFSRYPKKFIQMLIQYSFFQLSRFKVFNKNNRAPLGYVVVAKKP